MVMLWLFLVDVTALCYGVLVADTLAGGEPILRKPIGDHRSYEYARLANGMEVVSIKDASTKMAAIGVAVDAGSYYDPHVHYGLAHMTEHSMFLGSKKYPGVAEFDEFLAAHGGESNAYTADEATVYFGSLDVAGFHDGMAHFADMLSAPSLRKEAIWKETSAVLSEHEKNIDDPSWYTQRAMLNIANPDSPIQDFHTGDESTLKNYGAENLSLEIQSYVKKNYCPPRMHVVTLSSDSASSQLKRANDTFGAIPRLGFDGVCKVNKTEFSKPLPFPEDRLKKWLLVEGSQPSTSLLMLFPLSDLRQWSNSHPSSYAEYIMGYRGKGSLKLVLRDQLHLAGDIEMSVDHTSAGSMVWVSASLTALGEKKPQAVVDVILTFFSNAKKQCSQEVLTSLAKSAKIFWDWPSSFAEPMDAVSDVAESMTRNSFKELLTADALTDNPNQTRVLEFLNMLRPDKMNVALVTQNAAKLWSHSTAVKVLAHYGNNYTVTDFDDQVSNWKCWGISDHTEDNAAKASCKNLTQRVKDEGVSFEGEIKIALPGVIQDLYENMSLAHAQAGKGTDLVSQMYGESPGLIQDKGAMQLWFRSGWVSAEPRVKASFFLRAKKPNGYASTPRDVVLSRLCMSIANDELSQRLADIAMAGFDFSASQSRQGVSVSVSGFTPTLLKHTERMLGDLTSALDVENNVSLRRNLGEMMYGFVDHSAEPVKSAEADLKILLTPRTHSKQELYESVARGPEITFKEARHACEDTRKGPFQFTSLVMGNYANEDAMTLNQGFLGKFKTAMNVTSDEVEKITPLVMPATPVEVRRQNRREGDRNHVTIVNLFAGKASVEKRVLLGIVSSIYSQVVFKELRTMKELGYVVGGSVSEMSTVMTVSCYVQGEKMLPDAVEQECEHVMAVTVPLELHKLSDEDFRSHKDSFKATLLEGPLSSQDQKEHFEDPILLGGCANLRMAMLSFIDTVTSKSQLIQAWQDAVTPLHSDNSDADGRQHALPRKKVVVKYFGNGSPVSAAPTKDAMKQLLVNSGLKGTVADRLLKERAETLVLDDANSSLRESLVSQGGYFPVVLDCTWPAQDASGSDSSTIVSEGTKRKDARLVGKGEVDVSSKGVATISASGMKSFMRSETHKASISRHGSDALYDDAGVDEFSHKQRDEHEASRQRYSAIWPRPLILQPRSTFHAGFLEVAVAPKASHTLRGACPKCLELAALYPNVQRNRTAMKILSHDRGRRKTFSSRTK